MVTCLATPCVVLPSNSLIEVLKTDGGWMVSEEQQHTDGPYLCHAWRGKHHLIGKGETRGEAQVDLLEMIVELEWEECL